MAASDLKSALISAGEDWSPAWQRVFDLSPAYLAAYINLRQTPNNAQKLPRRIQELILLALDAACTHLFRPGVDAHTSAALKAGASPAEIIETLELCSALGSHSLAVGTPLLQQVLQERGIKLPTSLTQQQESIKARFQQEKKYWSERWDPVLILCPEFFEAYTAYSALPFQKEHSQLEMKYKELIYCAIDCSTTHLFEPGLKIHIAKAMDYGATAEEIMEVFQLATLLGSHSVLVGTEALEKALNTSATDSKSNGHR